MGYTSKSNPAQTVKTIEKFSKAGATWWLESLFGMKNSYEDMLIRIQQGIPVSKKRANKANLTFGICGTLCVKHFFWLQAASRPVSKKPNSRPPQRL